MGRFLFSFMPWWLFALMAAFFGTMVLPFYEDYRSAQTEQFFALNEGPPAIVELDNFNPSRDIGLLDEVHFNGQILATLGILRFGGEGLDFDAIVLGSDNGVPLAVLMFDTLSSDSEINQLISTADASNRVTVQGFLTTARRADVERELTRRGFSGRNVLTVEPYFGNRQGVIGEKVQDAQISFFMAAGVTVLFALLALWRFRRWRKRRAAKQARRAGKTQKPLMPTPYMPQQTQPPTEPAPSKPSPVQQAPVSSPWGAAQTQTSKPASKSTRQPEPKRIPESDPNSGAPVHQPAFQSVFPGGGSGFRFKSADEIVREYFGTVTTLTGSNSDS